ncbi:MAG: hypothetical protein Fur0041_19620 [Bacteroidia bacterium]
MKKTFLIVLMFVSLCSSAQDKAHRERMFGFSVFGSDAWTNFDQFHSYLLTPAVMGNGFPDDYSTYKRTFRFPLGGGLYFHMNRRVNLGVDFAYSQMKDNATKGAYEIHYFQGMGHFQYYLSPNSPGGVYLHGAIGYGRLQVNLTSMDSANLVKFGDDKEVAYGTTHHYGLTGPTGELGIGYNFYFMNDRANPRPMWKQNCNMFSVMMGASYQKTNVWKRSDSTIKGPLLFDPTQIFLRMSYTFGIVTEKEVENKGS